MHPNPISRPDSAQKTAGTTLKPAKAYNFAIEDASDRFKRHGPGKD